MATQKISIGPVPYEEDCAQLGRTADFDTVAPEECRAYRAALIAYYGPPPEGARLRVIANPHDFGTYYEVYVCFDNDDKAAADYAVSVEQGIARWEDAGFPPPYSYAGRGDLADRHFESANLLIADVITRLRAGDEIMPPVLAHLTSYYPQAVALADNRAASPAP